MCEYFSYQSPDGALSDVILQVLRCITLGHDHVGVNWRRLVVWTPIVLVGQALPC